MTNKRVLLGSGLLVLICIVAYLDFGMSSRSESPPGSTNRMAQFKKLLEPPIAPEDLSRSIKIIYAMGDERQTQELLEAVALVDAMRVAEPEVWTSLTFVLVIFASNIHREDPEWRWRWVRQGLLTCRKGFDATGGHPDLAYELAFQLKLTTYTVEPGHLELGLISKTESDPELQKDLVAPGQNVSQEYPISPSALALGWARCLKNKILTSSDPTGHTLKTGLRLTPVMLEAWIRSLCYLESMYQWHRKDFLKATHWLKSAEDQCEIVLRMDPQASLRIKEWRDFCRDLRPIVILDQRASEKGLDATEKRTILEQALKQAEALFANAKNQQARTDLDEGFVQGFISRCKQALR